MTDRHYTDTESINRQAACKLQTQFGWQVLLKPHHCNVLQSLYISQIYMLSEMPFSSNNRMSQIIIQLHLIAPVLLAPLAKHIFLIILALTSCQKSFYEVKKKIENQVYSSGKNDRLSTETSASSQNKKIIMKSPYLYYIRLLK